MAIAIFPSLEGESLEDVSIKLAEAWRIGQKGLDNGIILVAFAQDRKLRLEVGYGLEGSITDAVSSQIIREAIAPQFRQGRYAEGLGAAVDAVYARIEAGPGAGKRSAKQQQPWPIVGFGAVIAAIAVILGMEAMRSRRFVERRGFTAGRGRDSSGPVIVPWGWGGGGGSGWGGGGGGGGGGFSGGGGGFGGGGASGDW